MKENGKLYITLLMRESCKITGVVLVSTKCHVHVGSSHQSSDGDLALGLMVPSSITY